MWVGLLASVKLSPRLNWGRRFVQVLKRANELYAFQIWFLSKDGSLEMGLLSSGLIAELLLSKTVLVSAIVSIILVI